MKTATRVLAPILVILAVVLTYGRTTELGFAWDDTWLILENERLAEPRQYLAYMLFEREELWRPVKRLTLAADYALWGPDDPGGFHATNVALHAIACLMLYATARRLELNWLGASFAALLMAVHPAHVEAVANIANRKEPLALTFCLLTLWLWLSARGKRPRAPLSALAARTGLLEPETAVTAARLELTGLAAIAYLLALLSKEAAAFMLPVAVLAWELVSRAERPARLMVALAAGLAGGVALVVYLGVDMDIARHFNPERVHWLTLGATDSYRALWWTGIAAIGFYGRLLLWPDPLYADRAFAIASGPFAGAVVAGALLALAVVIAAVGLRKRLPIASFGLAWFGLMLVPFLHLVPLTHWLVAERFVYTPSAGIALALGAVLSRLERPGSRLVATVLGALLISACGVRAARQLPVWQNDRTMWAHTLEHNPESFYAWRAAGHAHVGDGDLPAAEAAFRRSLALLPGYVEAREALARCLLDQGRFAEALAESRTVVAAHPEALAPLVLLGNAGFRAGQHEQSIQAYRRALLIAPERDDIRFDLANVLYAARRGDEALELLGREPAPGDDAPRNLLRGRLHELAGRREEGLACYLAARQAAPADYRAWTASGITLLRLRRYDEGRDALARSLELNGDQPRIAELMTELR